MFQEMFSPASEIQDISDGLSEERAVDLHQVKPEIFSIFVSIVLPK